jgi:hypothetical protein
MRASSKNRQRSTVREIATAITLIASFSVVSGHARAEHSWTHLHKINAQSGTVDVYVDPGTIAKKGDLVQVWHLSDIKSDGAKLSSHASRSEFDCKNKKIRLLYTEVYFGSAMAAGKPTYKIDKPKAKFENFTLGTTAPAGIVYSFVCR